MRIRESLCALLLVGLVSSPVSASDTLRLIAHDGQFLGQLTCSGSKAVGNRFSTYGSRYSSTSIWNAYSTYGSKYSSQSPFNAYTSTPPALYNDDNDRVAYVSLNKYLSGKVISPWVLEDTLRDQCNELVSI